MTRRALGKGLDALIPGAGDDRGSAAARTGQPVRPGQAGQVMRVGIDRIQPNPMQPRRDFDERGLQELADSIRQKGLLQPVLLRALPDGVYELVAGERRLRAARLAGLTQLPAIVYQIESEQEMLELALIENVQREDLNAIETARAYDLLIRECGLTQDAIAERVGKSRAAVANTIRLLGLPDKVQQMVQPGELSEGHARALLGITDARRQLALARKTVSAGLSVRAVEEQVRRATGSPGGARGGRKGAGEPLSPRLQAIVEEMQRALGTKISLKGSIKRGTLRIEYYSPDDLARICERLDVELD
jgi:ParB family transcriptional regulator, chromosome partitioning protein